MATPFDPFDVLRACGRLRVFDRRQGERATPFDPFDGLRAFSRLRVFDRGSGEQEKENRLAVCPDGHSALSSGL